MKFFIEVRPNFNYIKQELKTRLQQINGGILNWDKPFEKTVDESLKEIFNFSFHRIINFDTTEKRISISGKFLNKNKKVDYKNFEHLMQKLEKNFVDLRIFKMDDNKSRKIIGHEFTKEFEKEINDKCHDWNVRSYNFNTNVKDNPENNLPSLLTQKIKATADNYYFLSNYESVKKLHLISDFINEYRTRFSLLVKDVETINKTGAVFKLECLLIKNLLIPIMERDIEYQLPIFIESEKNWKGDNAFEKFSIFASQSVKKSSDDKDKSYIIVDGASLIAEEFNFSKVYHYSLDEFRGLMLNVRIPKPNYANNNQHFLHQYVVNHFVMKYRNSNIYANDLFSQFAFFEQAKLKDVEKEA